jgi:hypothetical protein
MFGRSFEEWSRKLRQWYQQKRTHSPPLAEPSNPFSADQTATLEEILDDVMISSLVALNDNNDKQLDWCLAMTGSIITAVIIAVSLHPASQHPPLLPALTRGALFVLLLSSGFGVWAKLLLPGDKPFSASFRSPQLEQLLQRIRPQVKDLSNPTVNEQIDRVGEIKKLEYIQFRRHQLEGKVYTNGNAIVTCSRRFSFLARKIGLQFGFAKWSNSRHT